MSSILIVDSDGKSLSTLQRKLRRKFDARIALGARQALNRLEEEGPFAVVVAEFSMETMDGVDFLARVRERWPESTRILLSRAPMEVADLLRAINDAKVFHLLSSNCEETTLLNVVEKGVERFVQLSGSVLVMNETCAVFAKAVHEIVCWVRADVRDILSPVLPLVRGLSQRLKDPAPLLTETAFLASIIGLIALPRDLLDTITGGGEVAEQELLAFAAHPIRTVELIRHLPQMRDVETILRGYSDYLHLDLMPAPEEPTEMPTYPVGSTILALVMEYRLACFGKRDGGEVLARLRRHSVHPPERVAALEAELAGMDMSETPLTLDRLQPGMVLARSVTGTREGKEVVLAPEGYELSRTTIVFLRQSAKHGQVREPVYVRGVRLTRPEDSGNA